MPTSRNTHLSFRRYASPPNTLCILCLLLAVKLLMRSSSKGALARSTVQNASTGWTTAVGTSLPGRTRRDFFSLLTCRRARSPQVVIDLTLSDDEDVNVKPSNPSHSAQTSTLLIEVPPMQHGLPMFTTSGDHKSEKRDGASGMNYAENRPPYVPPISISPAAVPNFTQP